MQVQKIALVVGTRPQIIKSLPLVKALKNFDLEIIHSGQHYDYQLSKIIFKELDIPEPSVNLKVGLGTQIEQISKIMIRLERRFRRNRPDFIIIPGDTTSAIASSLAASKSGIKFAHLEAGARSYQFHMAEEINRRIIDHCANFLFAPTKSCLQNLIDEHVGGRSIFVGDTMYDLFLEQYAKQNLDLIKKNKDGKQILITIHRFENIEVGKNLEKICLIINNLVKRGYRIIFPIHPHTKKMLKKFKLNIEGDIIEPLSYIENLRVLAKSNVVITDSGGLQKEAYWMGTPCITFRDSTEWVETITEKANFLISTTKELRVKDVEKISSLKIKPKGSLFGSGKASKKIADYITKLEI